MDKGLFLEETNQNYTNKVIDNADLMYYVKRGVLTLEEARQIIENNGGELVYGYYKE